MSKNAINWFEIPVTDFERAKKFYCDVLGIEMESQEMMGMMMGFFPYGENSVSGALIANPDMKPSADGTVVYLNAGENLDGPLSKVEAAGGKVIMPKMKITDEIGHIAMFLDTEGNKVAFHSPK